LPFAPGSARAHRLVGAGRTETARLLFGADRPDSGSVELDGRRLRLRSPRDAIPVRHRIADRRSQGTGIGAQAVRARGISALPNLERFSRWGFMRQGAERNGLRPIPRQPAGQTPTSGTARADLSGGNQQKVVLAKCWNAIAKSFSSMSPRAHRRRRQVRGVPTHQRAGGAGQGHPDDQLRAAGSVGDERTASWSCTKVESPAKLLTCERHAGADHEAGGGRKGRMISRRDSWIAGYALPLYGIAHPFVLFPSPRPSPLGRGRSIRRLETCPKAVRIFAAPALLFPLPEERVRVRGTGRSIYSLALTSHLYRHSKRPLARSG